MSKLRFDVVQDAFKKKAAAVETPAGKISDYFGELVFNRDKMHKYLDAKTFNALVTASTTVLIWIARLPTALPQV